MIIKKIENYKVKNVQYNSYAITCNYLLINNIFIFTYTCIEEQYKFLNNSKKYAFKLLKKKKNLV